MLQDKLGKFRKNLGEEVKKPTAQANKPKIGKLDSAKGMGAVAEMLNKRVAGGNAPPAMVFDASAPQQDQQLDSEILAASIPPAPPVPGGIPAAPPVPGGIPAAPPVPGSNIPIAPPVPGVIPVAPPIPSSNIPIAPPVPGNSAASPVIAPPMVAQGAFNLEPSPEAEEEPPAILFPAPPPELEEAPLEILSPPPLLPDADSETLAYIASTEAKNEIQPTQAEVAQVQIAMPDIAPQVAVVQEATIPQAPIASVINPASIATPAAQVAPAPAPEPQANLGGDIRQAQRQSDISETPPVMPLQDSAPTYTPELRAAAATPVITPTSPPNALENPRTFRVAPNNDEQFTTLRDALSNQERLSDLVGEDYVVTPSEPRGFFWKSLGFSYESKGTIRKNDAEVEFTIKQPGFWSRLIGNKPEITITPTGIADGQQVLSDTNRLAVAVGRLFEQQLNLNSAQVVSREASERRALSTPDLTHSIQQSGKFVTQLEQERGKSASSTFEGKLKDERLKVEGDSPSLKP